MKKLCIFLLKLERGYFVLTVLILGILVFSIVGDVDKMMPKMNGSTTFIVLFVFFIAEMIARRFFYSDEELKQQEMNGNIVMSKGYFIVSDKYFQTKINTELSFAKRLSGYTYVILGKLIGFACFYFISVILCGLVNKLWVG